MSARRFFHHVALLTGGTAAAQLVLLLVAPVLTRLYTPEDFGVRSVFVSMLTVLVAVATGRYHMAIVLESADQDAVNLAAVSALVTLLVSAIVWLAWWFVASSPDLFGTHASTAYFSLLPASLLGAGVYVTLSQWAVRTDRYWDVARAKVAHPTAQLVPQVILGLAYAGPLGLLVGDTVGRLSSAFILGGPFARTLSATTRRISLRAMRSLACKHWRMPTFSVWGGLLQAVSVQLPTLALAWEFGSSAAGWYSVAALVIQSPFLILGQAVAQVFYREAAQTAGTRPSGDLAVKVLVRLIVLGTAPMLLLAATAVHLFPFILGRDWDEAGRYAQALVPFVLAVFLTSHLLNLVFLLGRERSDMAFQLLLFFCRAGVLSWGVYLHEDPVLVIGVYSLLNGVALLAYAFWLLSLAGSPIWRSGVALGRELGLSLLLVAPAALAVEPRVLHPVAAIGLSTLLVAARVGYSARDFLRQLPDAGRR